MLDRNERTIELNKKIIDKLSKKISKVNIGLYPELDSFYSKLSKWLRVKKENLFITEGVSGGIKSIIETTCKENYSNIIFPDPSFALYKVYANTLGIKYKTIRYNVDFNFDINKIYKIVDNKTAIIFLPNPNIPLEYNIKKNDIIKLLKFCKRKKILLILDEVYYPFGGSTYLSLIKDYKELLIMRSFSKAFGLAGIRIGFIIGNKRLINYISKIRTGYETNSLSIEAASFFLDNYNLVNDYIDEIKLSINQLKLRLKSLGIESIGGKYSNYLFINLKKKYLANKITYKLEKNGIYVRSKWSKPFDKGILVSGSSKKNLSKFFQQFKKIYIKINK